MKHVLVVDDDPATREGLSELLEGAGYDTASVGSFHDGLEHLRGCACDLLITDIRLGAYNGLQLVVNGPAEIPAIVISGFADSVLEREARRHGAAYVQKPVRPADLLELVRQTLFRAAEDDAPVVDSADVGDVARSHLS